jgi:hypothetical protein
LSSGQLCQLLQQYFVVRNPFLNEADKTFTINDIGNPSAAEETTDLALLVGNQGIGDPVEFAEFPMGVKAVTTDAQDLGIELCKAGKIPLKSLQFACSDRGEVGEIERQNQMLLTQQVADMEGSPRRFPGKQRYRLSHIQGVCTQGADGDPGCGQKSFNQFFHLLSPFL